MIAAQSTARKFLRSWRLAGPPARSAATDEPLGLLPHHPLYTPSGYGQGAALITRMHGSNFFLEATTHVTVT